MTAVKTVEVKFRDGSTHSLPVRALTQVEILAGTFSEIAMEAPVHAGRAAAAPATLASAMNVDMPVNFSVWMDGERVLSLLERRQITKYLLQRGVGS